MLPDRIAVTAPVRSGAAFAGELELAKMPRLLDVLQDSGGRVAVELRLGADDDGVRFLAGRIRGELTLQCQRCLGPVVVPIDIEVSLGLVEGLSAAERLPERYEPLLVQGREVVVKQVVEDELLLAVPIVPRHVDSRECRAIESEEDTAGEARPNPFAVLADLKRRS